MDSSTASASGPTAALVLLPSSSLLSPNQQSVMSRQQQQPQKVMSSEAAAVLASDEVSSASVLFRCGPMTPPVDDHETLDLDRGPQTPMMDSGPNTTADAAGVGVHEDHIQGGDIRGVDDDDDDNGYDPCNPTAESPIQDDGDKKMNEKSQVIR